MNFYDTKRFGEHIRSIREHRGYTRDTVSQLSGISKRALINIEQGKSIPNLETLHILSIVLGADLLSFLKRVMFSGSSEFIIKSQEINKTINSKDFTPTIDTLNDYISNLEEDRGKAQFLTKNNLEKEILLISLHQMYHGNWPSSFEILFKKVVQTLADFNYDFFSNEQYDYTDFRIGLLLADASRRLNKFTETKRILDRISEQIVEETLSYEVYAELKILLLASYSIYYHRISNYEEVIRVCYEGIEASKKCNTLNYLYIFLYRLSVAKFRIGDESYKKNLNMTIFNLYSTDNNEVIFNLVNALKKQYPEMYDYINSRHLLNEIVSECGC